MNLSDKKQAMLTYLVRLRRFSKTTSLVSNKMRFSHYSNNIVTVMDIAV